MRLIHDHFQNHKRYEIKREFATQMRGAVVKGLPLEYGEQTAIDDGGAA